MQEVEVDKKLLSLIQSDWQKVALVIGKIMQASLDLEGAEIAARLELLIEAGQIEVSGDLTNWRACEVRLLAIQSKSVRKKPDLKLVKSGGKNQAVTKDATATILYPRPRKSQNQHTSEEQKRRLKNLIDLGKERGYLTQSEISTHLPDMVDTEQISEIVEMFEDIGISVRFGDEVGQSSKTINAGPFFPFVSKDVLIIDNDSFLGQFLGGNFHPDWTNDHKSTEEVLRAYLDNEPTDAIRRTFEELSDFLDKSNFLTEEHLSRLMFQQGAYFRTKYESRSARDWLNAMQAQIETALKEGNG